MTEDEIEALRSWAMSQLDLPNDPTLHRPPLIKKMSVFVLLLIDDYMRSRALLLANTSLKEHINQHRQSSPDETL